MFYFGVYSEYGHSIVVDTLATMIDVCKWETNYNRAISPKETPTSRLEKLPSTGVGTDMDTGTDTGVGDNTYGCQYEYSYRRSKDSYGMYCLV